MSNTDRIQAHAPIPDDLKQLHVDLTSAQMLTLGGKNYGPECYELIKRVSRLEQERDQLRTSHAELMRASKCAYQAMAGNNDPFDPEVWSNAVLQLGQAIKNGSQVQAGNRSSV
jgi:hypothetical protein